MVYLDPRYQGTRVVPELQIVKPVRNGYKRSKSESTGGQKRTGDNPYSREMPNRPNLGIV